MSVDPQSIEYAQGRARAKANGISAPTFRVRVVQCDWSIERAATEPPKKARIPTHVGRLCKKYDIQHSQYKRWEKYLPEGTPTEEIAQVAQQQAANNVSKQLKSNDVLSLRKKLTRYQQLVNEAKKFSPAALAEEYGVSIGTVYKQLETIK